MARQLPPEEEERHRKEYGQPLKYDANFKGPRKRRSCTDVICLMLFFVFLVVWGFISFYAWKVGTPEKLVTGVDSLGRRCGVDSQVSSKPVLFYFDLTKCASTGVLINGCPTPQVCLESCPRHSWSSLPYRSGRLPFNLAEVQNNLICQNEETKKIVTNANMLQKVIADNLCADWYIPTTKFHTRCLPFSSDLPSPSALIEAVGPPVDYDLPARIINSSLQLQEVVNFNELGHQMLEDLNKCWKYLILAACSAVLISLVYIVLLRWMAGVITWITLLGIVALFSLLSGYSYVRWDHLKRYGPDLPSGKIIQGQIDKIVNSTDFWMFLLVMGAIFALISLLVIIFLRKRIVISVALIKEGSKAVGSVLASLVFPIIPWILQGGVFAWAVVVGLHLASIGNPIFKVYGLEGSTCECTGDYQHIKNGDICNVTLFNLNCHGPSHSNDLINSQCATAGCRYVSTDAPGYVPWMHLANVFAGFWCVWFVSGVSQMILAGVFATWYWTFNKGRLPFFTITISAFTTFRYHLGTVAFGSLIISICSVIRAFIEYTQQKLKKFDNGLVRAIFCCLKCFFWCLEKFLKFINRNAYIMCAIHGKNFCSSAQNAFNLLMRNALRVAVLDKVTDFLFFIGKLAVSGAVLTSWYFAVFSKPQVITLNHIWLPLVLIAIFSYLIASLFFSVYTMAVNTLLLCFLEDIERNDGSRERPYFMSKNLMKILGKRNKRIDKNK